VSSSIWSAPKTKQQPTMIGLDEAGVGPALGSMWASAVHIPEEVEIPGLTDSKKLTEKKRTRLRQEIVATCLYGLGEVTHTEIDTLGLGECRRLVFERALDDLFRKHPDMVVDKIVVDGTIFREYRGIPHECVPKADLTNPHVSAASILAKTTRDRQVIELCDVVTDLDAKYGIRSNKGYLGPSHIKGLQEHGFSEYHRTSYKIKGFNK
jgi:ribonuclease HII